MAPERQPAQVWWPPHRELEDAYKAWPMVADDRNAEMPTNQLAARLVSPVGTAWAIRPTNTCSLPVTGRIVPGCQAWEGLGCRQSGAFGAPLDTIVRPTTARVPDTFIAPSYTSWPGWLDSERSSDDDHHRTTTLTMSLTAPNAVTATLRELLEDSVPSIAVSFTDLVRADDIAQAVQDGLDVAELRIDRYRSFSVSHVVEQVKRFSDLPTIATIRTQDEGGDWSGTEPERRQLFEAILPHVDGIDIELSSIDILPGVVEAAKAQSKIVIISNHNFETTPPVAQLEEMAKRAKSLGADHVKLSAMAESEDDVRTLAQFTLQNSAMGIIVIAMGPRGALSRVFFPRSGRH